MRCGSNLTGVDSLIPHRLFTKILQVLNPRLTNLIDIYSRHETLIFQTTWKKKLRRSQNYYCKIATCADEISL